MATRLGARWHAALLTVFALLSPLALVTRAQANPTPPQPLAIEGATAYEYKAVHGGPLRLHVFKAEGTASGSAQPAIVFFFGGNWTRGSVTQFVPQARYLAQRGMVAAVADYRVFDRHGTSPFEAMADAKSAVRWLRTHARELDIDPQRIVAAGGSSGGHIALTAAVFDQFDERTEDLSVSSRPNALVLFNPAVDTTHSKPDVWKERFGERGREASPAHHALTSLPPTLILHGRNDALVPFVDVERYCAQAAQSGRACKLVAYEGAAHGFFNPENKQGQWYRETLQEMDQFLVGLGYLPPPAPGR